MAKHYEILFTGVEKFLKGETVSADQFPKDTDFARLIALEAIKETNRDVVENVDLTGIPRTVISQGEAPAAGPILETTASKSLVASDVAPVEEVELPRAPVSPPEPIVEDQARAAAQVEADKKAGADKSAPETVVEAERKANEAAPKPASAPAPKKDEGKK